MSSESRRTSSPAGGFCPSRVSLYVKRGNSPRRESSEIFMGPRQRETVPRRPLFHPLALPALFPFARGPCHLVDATTESLRNHRRAEAPRATFAGRICNNCQFTRYDTFDAARWPGIADKFAEKFRVP